MINPSNLFPNVPYVPLEISTLIATHLGPKDLGTCAQLCRNWKQLSDCPYLWKNLFWHTFPDKSCPKENWKHHFRKTVMLQQFENDLLENVSLNDALATTEQSLASQMIKHNLTSTWERKVFLEHDPEYNVIHNKIFEVRKKILSYPPHTILKYLFENNYGSLPQLPEERIAETLKSEDLNAHSMIKGRLGEHDRFVAVQVYTDRDHNNIELVKVKSVAVEESPSLLIYYGPIGELIQCATLFTDGSFKYKNLFYALKHLFQNGILDEKEHYLKIV